MKQLSDWIAQHVKDDTIKAAVAEHNRMTGLLLCKINKVTVNHRHGIPISKKSLDNLSNFQIEYENFINQGV